MRFAPLLLLAACGDNLEVIVPAEAMSGERLKLQTYRYGDGARQVDPTSAYDVVEGTRCRPQAAGTPGKPVTDIFTDEAPRCMPVGDEAVFTDAECTVPVGRARSELFPTHFSVFDSGPVHVYRAGPPIDPPTEVFSLRTGVCVGPVPVTEELPYYATRGEVPITSLVRFTQVSAFGDRLEIPLYATDDGLRLPLGIIDTGLGVACVPQVAAGDEVPCEPIGAVPSYAYADAQCTQPVAFGPAEPAPTASVVYMPDGCPSYRSVGERYQGDVFVSDGTSCFAFSAPEDMVAFRVDTPADIVRLTRTIGTVPGQRLQRIGLADGGLVFESASLWDTTVDGPCSATTIDGVTRCLPARTVSARTLFGPDCTTEIQFAEVARACETARMARVDDVVGPRLMPIGAPLTEPVYWPVDGCTPYPVREGFELRRLGAPLRLDDFPVGVYAGER